MLLILALTGLATVNALHGYVSNHCSWPAADARNYCNVLEASNPAGVYLGAGGYKSITACDPTPTTGNCYLSIKDCLSDLNDVCVLDSCRGNIIEDNTGAYSVPALPAARTVMSDALCSRLPKVMRSAPAADLLVNFGLADTASITFANVHWYSFANTATFGALNFEAIGTDVVGRSVVIIRNRFENVRLRANTDGATCDAGTLYSLTVSDSSFIGETDDTAIEVCQMLKSEVSNNEFNLGTVYSEDDDEFLLSGNVFYFASSPVEVEAPGYRAGSQLVNIVGNAFYGTEVYGAGFPAIFVDNLWEVHVDSNDVRGLAIGISLEDCYNSSLNGNSVAYAALAPLEIYEDDVETTQTGVVTASTFSHNLGPIAMWDTMTFADGLDARLTFENNNVDLTWGLSIQNYHTVNILSNTFTNIQLGLFLSTASNGNLRYNTFTKAGSSAVTIYDVTSSSSKGNSISSALVCFDLDTDVTEDFAKLHSDSCYLAFDDGLATQRTGTADIRAAITKSSFVLLGGNGIDFNNPYQNSVTETLIQYASFCDVEIDDPFASYFANNNFRGNGEGGVYCTGA